MVIYNVTIKVDLSVHDVWLQWMKQEHIPHVMETGCFVEYKLYRLLEENTTDGITYAVKYFAKELTDYFDYKEKYASALQKEALDTFPDKFTAFRTLMREV